MSTYRTFIAIELPQSIRALIAYHIDQLRSTFPHVRASWLREDNLHLTLKFLGDVPIARIPALSDAAAEAARSNESFDLIVSGCGSFPPRGQPSVLWIGISSPVPQSPTSNTQHPNASLPPTPNPLHPIIAPTPNPLDATLPPSPLPLTLLHGALEDACAAAGFERDTRPFHPHLTIARLRESKGSRALAEHHKQLSFAPQTFTVSDLIVFRSRLTSEGAQHEPLSRHKLR